MMSAEWSLVIRCRRSILSLVSFHGTQSEMETRARLAETWGDGVEYLGLKIKNEAHPEERHHRLKDFLKRDNDTFRDFQ